MNWRRLPTDDTAPVGCEILLMTDGDPRVYACGRLLRRRGGLLYISRSKGAQVHVIKSADNYYINLNEIKL